MTRDTTDNAQARVRASAYPGYPQDSLTREWAATKLRRLSPLGGPNKLLNSDASAHAHRPLAAR